jgi:DNA polymerase-3 subunit alpha
MAGGSLFGDDEELTKVSMTIDELPEYDGKDILSLEKETLGFYVSGHPLDEFRAEIEGIKHSLSSEIDTIADGSKTLFIGKIENIVSKISKKGNKFGIVTLMDFHGDIEFMVFEKTLVQIAMMDQNRPIAFKVQITKDDRGVNKRVLKVSDLEGAKKEKTDIKKEVKQVVISPIFVKIEISSGVETLNALHKLVKEYPGSRPLKLILSSKLQDVVIESNISVNEMIVEKLEAITSIKVAA